MEQVETPDGQFLVRRHTIPVQPAQLVAARDRRRPGALGPQHCHLMLHMDMGMFRVVVVIAKLIPSRFAMKPCSTLLRWCCSVQARRLGANNDGRRRPCRYARARLR